MKSSIRYGLIIALLFSIIYFSGCTDDEPVVMMQEVTDAEEKAPPVEVIDIEESGAVEEIGEKEAEEPRITITRPQEAVEEEIQEEPSAEEVKVNQTKSPSSGDLKIKVFNIRNGNAIYMQTPSGKHVLLNTGPKENADLISFDLRKNGVKEIEAVIITDITDDNYGALTELMGDYTVKRVYDNGLEYTRSSTYLKYKQGLEITDYHLVEADGKINIDPKMEFELIVPYDTAEKELGKTETIVVRIKYGKFWMLFMGDCDLDCEPYIINKDIEADAFVMADHGAKTATSTKLIDAIGPQAAIVQSGEDIYIKTARYLEESGVKLFDTYNDKGDILVESDGNTFNVKALI